MKKFFGLVILILFSVTIQLTAQTGFAYSDPLPGKVPPVKTISKLELIETNYLAGLQTGNAGIKASCAYFLGEMKSKKALFPLMEMFRETESGGEKLVIAWSLLKIGDSRGAYLVKQAAQKEKNRDIRIMLEYLYKDYSLKTNGRIDSN
jgi:hypothetical protein